jgi:hypothetical protein
MIKKTRIETDGQRKTKGDSEKKNDAQLIRSEID